MKKVLFIFLFLLSAVTISARTTATGEAQSLTPCTDAWRACIDVNGYPDAGCDAGWKACITALY